MNQNEHATNNLNTNDNILLVQPQSNSMQFPPNLTTSKQSVCLSYTI